MKSSTQSTVFLSFPLNFYFCRFLVPFYVKRDAENNQYCHKSNILHQFVCGLFHVFWIGVQISFVFRNDIVAKRSSILAGIIDFIMNTMTWILTIVSMKTLWLEKEKLTQLLEGLKTSIARPKLIKSILIAILLLITLLTLMVDIEYYGGIWNFVDLSKDLRQCKGKGTNCVISTPINTMHVLINFLHRLETLAFVNLRGIFVCNGFTYLGLGLSFWAVAKELKRKFGNSVEFYSEDVQMGISRYHTLKTTVNHANELVGNQLFVYCIVSLLYAVMMINFLMEFRKQSLIAYVLYNISFCVILFTWLMFANYFGLVQTLFKDWLDFHHFQNPKSPSFSNDVRMKLASIQFELEQGSLAVSCQYFSVTSGFLGQMFGLIVTYGIIVFQTGQNYTS